MAQSEEIKDLALALNMVQANLEGAVKDSNNPFFKSSYADLASVWGACRANLAENGFAVPQTTKVPSDGREGVIIVTTLIHTSGQWIAGELFVPYEMAKDKKTGAMIIKSDPQALGSAITYGRRYALMAILGMCPVDDDGENAMEREETSKAKSKSKPEPKKDEVNTDEFAKAIMKECSRIGEEAFWKVLGTEGYENLDELRSKDKDERVRVYNLLRKEANKDGK